ncbi:Tubulin/FtsZ GTPase [Sulfuricurvum kujiense DSM 16994]|uniref:Tubulin/FtsZ GTPase n=1 Tax=Sulfuricurvum kujiense (strain ATCC BAA-921 / DSM 16994 / JCM 11577 / YK-1) TaxID=709032 RepID=E4U0Y4_SULKY|nr:cell division protein FtsZ [Sulfuricurvum kujiense]ADR34386.1 Tubulin/FtsZ GTPase [Sulfuricurvum kujiense DSM 16994]
MYPFDLNETNLQNKLKIVAIGVGSSGENIIEYIQRQKVQGIKLIIVNSWYQESSEELSQALSDADIVFITFGLGGNTTSLSSQIIAKIAKESSALTIAVVTKPFRFEGQKRRQIADSCLMELKNICDSVVVIPCDKLLESIDPTTKIQDSFKFVDSIVSNVIFSISGVIFSSGDNDINLDINDLRTIMSKKGSAIVGIGENQGNNAAYEAITSAIDLMSTDDLSIKNATGVLVHFTLHPEFDFIKLSTAIDIIHSNVGESADVIFGTTTDKNIPIDFIQITIIATGFEKVLMVPVNNVF